jgi:hypothetical protein
MFITSSMNKCEVVTSIILHSIDFDIQSVGNLFVNYRLAGFNDFNFVLLTFDIPNTYKLRIGVLSMDCY